MSGLFHSLNIGSESLFANRQGIDTAAHNIANAHTKGFSRQSVELAQRHPSERDGVIIGNGVYTGSIKRSHDKFIEQQVNKANAMVGNNVSRHTSMLNVEAIFSPELASSVTKEMNSFFDAMQGLSNFPEEATVRTNVLEKGKNLAASFRQVDAQLRTQRQGMDDEVMTITGQLTEVTKNIASLNSQIRQAEAGPNLKANDLRDKRDVLVRSLSEMVNITYYEDQFGMMTIRGPGETLLVDRGKSADFSLRINEKNNGMHDVLVWDFEGNQARDVTKQITSGKLEGLIDVRDRIVDDYLDKNNELAYTFANQFNEVHRMGFGLKDFALQSGRNFFAVLDDKSTAAQNMHIDSSIINSTDAIGTASTQNVAGDNVNVNRLLALQSAKVLDDNKSSFAEYYSNFVGQVGVETLRAQHQKESSEILLTDLNVRSDSVSGVSLDEEATSMMKWQTAFTASSKVITTVDQMLDTLLNMKR